MEAVPACRPAARWAASSASRSCSPSSSAVIVLAFSWPARHRRAEEPADRDRRSGRGGRGRRGRPSTSSRRAPSTFDRGRRPRRGRRSDRDTRGLRRGHPRAASPRCSPPPPRARSSPSCSTASRPALEEGVNAQAAAAAGGRRRARGTAAHRRSTSRMSCRSPTPTRAAPASPRRSSRSCSAACWAASRSPSSSSALSAGWPRCSIYVVVAGFVRRRHPAGLVRRAAGRLPGQLRWPSRSRSPRSAHRSSGSRRSSVAPGIAVGPVVILLFANPISSAGGPDGVPARAVGRGRPVVPAGSRGDPHPRALVLPRGRQDVPMARARRHGRPAGCCSRSSATSAPRAVPSPTPMRHSPTKRSPPRRRTSPRSSSRRPRPERGRRGVLVSRVRAAPRCGAASTRPRSGARR